ncbi:glutaredoxin [Mycobacterium phage Leopard]|uniref:Glutaredoxin n=1 Tax=Mycobacterium phage Onyinye TaxID=2686235 RepID=A0A6B9LD21_9CAUD|nr:thioredoxin domain [Mycobacterium phage Onyinye]QHB37458.1 glutaredoxin [Mycobacterium phage Onyinye]UOW92929.1 glutaredoxin [Mycobacterium phage Leopard]WKW85214.1 glutaredoxin [Mycobacterium phage Aikoy]
MTITVYTKPDCGQCEQTKKQLERKGLSYNVVDVFEDEDARKFVEATGNLNMPMVVVREGDKIVRQWHGFRYDEIKTLSKDS